ncbi:MAG: hypothetical protein E7380_03095 [Clostridiales bacterium]|nr:hypothetical protein [Clostridiales bacterium]
MEKNRRADAVMFGFDFQINSAIVLMIENIKDLKSIRLESNEEDIKLTLNDDSLVLAQAKAVREASWDFRNVRANINKALTTLSEQSKKKEVKQFIFITNSPNPFNDAGSRSVFYGHAHRKYSSLPPSAKKIVQDYLSKIEESLDLEKLYIHVLPFETDDDTERYKVVMQVVNDFVGRIGASLSPGIGEKLFKIWNYDVFKNGTKRDESIELTKKSIVWPIVVIETDINRCEQSFLEQFDIGIYDEVVRVYASIINSCCERMEFVTRVLFDYTQFNSSKTPRDKYNDFIESTWANYREDFAEEKIAEDVLEALVKIILYNIIRRRYAIDKLKKEVNL